MKKQTLTFAIVFLFSIQIKAQNNLQPNNIPQANIPPRTVVEQHPNLTPHILKISSVTLSIDSSVNVSSGAGAVKNYFRAVINSTGVGTIEYQWVLKLVGGAQTYPPSLVHGTLQLSGTGTDVIFTERDHVLHSPERTLILQILSPIMLPSNLISF